MTLLIFIVFGAIALLVLGLLFGVLFGSFWVEDAWKKSRAGKAWARRFGTDRK